MPEHTMDIAGGDMTLPFTAMPVYRLKHIDDDSISGCSDLDYYGRCFIRGE